MWLEYIDNVIFECTLSHILCVGIHHVFSWNAIFSRWDLLQNYRNINFLYVIHTIFVGLGICGQLSWLSKFLSVKYLVMIDYPFSIIIFDIKISLIYILHEFMCLNSVGDGLADIRTSMMFESLNFCFQIYIVFFLSIW